MRPFFDGVNENGRRFLDLFDKEICWELSSRKWMKIVGTCFKGEAKKWMDDNKEIKIILQKKLPDEADKERFIQLICEEYPVVRKHKAVDKLRDIKQATNETMRSVLPKYNVIKKARNIKQGSESIQEYYERINNSFIVELGYRDRTEDVTLSEGELIWLAFVIEKWIRGVKSTKLFDYLADKPVDNLFDAYTIAERKLQKEERKRQQKEEHIRLQQQLQKIVDHDTNDVSNVQTQKPYESLSILEEQQAILKEISTAVDITNTETPAKPTASESVKWAMTSTSLQWSSPETSFVNKSPSISLERPYQTQENCSGSSSRTPPPAHISKPWLTQNWRARPSPKASIVDESPPVLEQMPCNLPEINATIVDISDTESMAEILASGPVKWSASTTGLQTPLLEASLIDESPPVLEQIRPEISEISVAIVDSSDTESTDEVLASGPDKRIAASAEEKEVFDSTVTLHAISKSPPVLHIEKDIEAVEAPDKACAESIVDVETLNQEVFALAAIFDAFSKNSPASYSEDTEISAAVDISSLEHLTEQDDSTAEAFDSTTATGESLKNPSIQHIEDPETMEKTSKSAFTDSASESAYIYKLPALPAFDLSIDIDFDPVKTHTKEQIPCETTCELPAFPAFDLSIDIDFEAYTTDTETESFGWSRSCTGSISHCTSSVSTCTSVSDVDSITSIVTSIDTDVTSINVMNKDFYEGEQLSCFPMYPSTGSASLKYTTESDPNFYEGEQSSCSVESSVSASIECVISEDTDFYEREQFCSPVDIDDVDVVVTRIDAFILTAGMVKKKKKKESAWMSLLSSVLLLVRALIEYLVTKTKHKGLPKVKIKKLSEPEHINSRSQIIAGISVKSAYKTALFSGIQQGLGSLR